MKTKRALETVDDARYRKDQNAANNYGEKKSNN